MRGGRKEANRAELIFNLKIVFEKLETFNPIFCQTLVRRVTESDSLKQAKKKNKQKLACRPRPKSGRKLPNFQNVTFFNSTGR
jgi:hypothetical protein